MIVTVWCRCQLRPNLYTSTPTTKLQGRRRRVGDEEEFGEEESADCGCTCDNCVEGDHDNCEGEDRCDWTTEDEEDTTW